MKKIRVAINGFGRIGRPTFRIILDHHPELEVVAINDLTDPKVLAHLLKYDSLYGHYKREVSSDNENLIIDQKKFRIYAEKDPAKLPWKELAIDIVLECTGRFTDLAGSSKHLEAGAKRVIISAPPKDPEIPIYLLGVNEKEYKGEKIISNGSCTTNCLAPVVNVLNNEFGIERSFMTTVHSYTNDQRLLDLPHRDLRRARAAAYNMIPTTTGANRAVVAAIPSLKGKLEGISIRVPTPVVSLIDLVAQVKKKTSVEEVNKVFTEESEGRLKNILAVTSEPLVSSDFRGDPHSAIVDLSFTAVEGDLVKVLAWYDNEWGYANRFAEMAGYVGESI